MNTPSAARMRAEREARSWSQRDAVRRLRALTADPLPAEESLLRSWKKWEAGDHQPDDFYKPLIAKLFGTVTAAMFPDPAPKSVDTALLAANGMTTLEILSRIRMSSIDSATLDSLRITANQLACEYPYMPSDQLRMEGQQWLRRITNLLNHNLTLAQHEEVLSLAGMVALLVGCVENDMGDRRAADATRRSALSLGTEARNARVVGWAHEMNAWFSLTDGDYRGVLAAADAGLAAAGQSDVSVQLLAQKAKAYARMGNERLVESTLETGRELLEKLPYPDDVANHFVIDPDKWDFYVMDCYRISGQNELARTYAEGVIRAGTDSAGNERSPMRNAEARITLGVVAAREGDLSHAVDLGERAISGNRQSVPSLLMVSTELEAELARTFPGEPDTAEYVDHLRTLRTAAVL